MHVYKILPQSEWQAALNSGHYAGAPIDLADGFIHFSAADQVQETAAKHFRGQYDLMLLAIDPDHYGDAMKWEPSRGGALFPHLYGPFELSSVVWAKALETNSDGIPQIPDLSEGT